MVLHVTSIQLSVPKPRLSHIRWQHNRNVKVTVDVQHGDTFPKQTYEEIAVMTLINPDEYKNKAGEGEPNSAIRVKAPKRILHFSDGILEEYSDDEVDNTPKVEEMAVVDPNSLTWGPWLWYKTWRAGAGTLAVVDSVGEFLAAFFGITTPKYYFELEEYKRREAEAKKESEQKQGWSEASGAENFTLNEINTKQPQPVEV